MCNNPCSSLGVERGAGTCFASTEPSSCTVATQEAAASLSLWGTGVALEDKLSSEVHEGLRHLAGLSSARRDEVAALEDLTRVSQLAQQRQAEKDRLCASLVDDLAALQQALLEARQELAEEQRLRAGEAALAQQAQQKLAARDAQVQEQAAVLKRLEAELQAEQTRRQAAEGSSQAQQAVATGMGMKARKLEAQVEEQAQAQVRLQAAAEQAEARAVRAEELARREQQRGRSAVAELGALKEQREADAAARQTLEGAKATLAKQLAEAQKLCLMAGEECSRVRRRNEQLERQVANELARRQATGVDQVLEDLEQLEGMMGEMPG